jgi:hypothetical protein
VRAPETLVGVVGQKSASSRVFWNVELWINCEGENVAKRCSEKDMTRGRGGGGARYMQRAYMRGNMYSINELDGEGVRAESDYRRHSIALLSQLRSRLLVGRGGAVG